MNTRLIFKCYCLLILTLTLSFLNSHAFADKQQNLEQRIAALEEKLKSKNNSLNLSDNIKFSGLFEVEASYNDPDSGDSESDIVMATAELGAEAALSDTLSAVLTLLYEEDEGTLPIIERG